MERMVWNEDLRVGVEEIDSQHQTLIDIRNRLAECCSDDDPAQQERFHHILSELFEYTRSHFIAEEHFMQWQEFPGLDRQRQEHAEFIDAIVEFSKAASNGRDVRVESVNYLSRWLLSHICQSDMEIRYFIEGRHS